MADTITIQQVVAGTPTFIEGVMSINIDDGRRNETDPFRGGTAQYTYLQSVNGTPTQTPEMGETVIMTAVVNGVAKYPYLFIGLIADIEYTYNIAGVNTYTVTVTDALSQCGQSTVSNLTQAAALSGTQITTLLNNSSVGVSGSIDAGLTTCSGWTYTGNVLDQLNKIAATEQGTLYVNNGAVWYLQRNTNQSTPAYSFTLRTNTGTNKLAYDSVTVASAISNYFNYIVVEPDGLSPVTSSYSTAGVAKKTYSIDTLNVNTTDAQYLADYLWGKYSDAGQNLESVSTIMGAQSSDTNKAALVSIIPNQLIQVDLNNATSVKGTVIGRSVSATAAAGIRFTFYFSGASLTDSLVLDSTTFGILNTNRLGY